ncbi:non-homologous end joining protein Ku-like [Panicum virgatum]|uniref:non-homologous end joining protein Ku-like n=1 Tax=Panicum virgatum TaxID=38727 RepID=UPI0019D5299E|nr:non-homologous end joining protein Ku-like [Panicum virgatum]
MAQGAGHSGGRCAGARAAVARRCCGAAWGGACGAVGGAARAWGAAPPPPARRGRRAGAGVGCGGPSPPLAAPPCRASLPRPLDTAADGCGGAEALAESTAAVGGSAPVAARHGGRAAAAGGSAGVAWAERGGSSPTAARWPSGLSLAPRPPTAPNPVSVFPHSLMRKPRLLAKVREELDAVVGRDAVVEEAHLPQLPYLHPALKETLRLHPALPLMVPHCPNADATIAGYRVPAGSRVLMVIFFLLF